MLENKAKMIIGRKCRRAVDRSRTKRLQVFPDAGSSAVS